MELILGWVDQQLSTMTVLSGARLNILFLLTCSCQVELDFTHTCWPGTCFDSILTCLCCEAWIGPNHSFLCGKNSHLCLRGTGPSAAHTGVFWAVILVTVPNGQFPWFLGSFDGFTLRPGSHACDLQGMRKEALCELADSEASVGQPEFCLSLTELN